MEQKQIAFSTEYQNVSHPHVLCDKNRFNRVLLNLVSNAYKFTDQGGSVLITLCETDFADCQASYEIRVKDSGIGMTEEFAGKVFEAFERERTSTVSGIEGTGLGMAISKSIIEQMGGTIDVDTTPGIGTEFIIRVSFPVASGPCKEINVPEADKTPVPEVDFSGKRLLLAEDNPVNCDIATLILSDLGFIIDYVENGQMAVDQLVTSSPGYYDVILMDIQMPVLNGYDATRKIRALTDPGLSQIPIIAITANAFAEDIQAEKDAGMNAHISKPFDIDEMINTLALILCTG